MKNFSLLISDAKLFMANELNRVLVFLFLFASIFLVVEILEFREIRRIKSFISLNSKNIETDFDKTRKKIDYRYFNLTRTMEETYNIKVDTKTGELKK